MNSMSAPAVQAIGYEVFADLFEESEVHETNDMGGSVTHIVTHPQRGKLALTSNCIGGCSLMQLQ